MNLEHEKARLDSLLEYDILDTEPEKAFDDLTHLAAEICGVPVALVSIIDSTRQWFKAKVGIDLCETDRESAFCNYTIRQKDPLIVPDALNDSRFAQNPFVTKDPHIRFYAGYPLLSREGHGLGSLCVVDTKPRKLTESQISALSALGRQVETHLELRRRLREEAEAARKLQEKTHELETVFNVFPDRFFQLDQDGIIIDYHGGHAATGGPFSNNCVGRRFRDLLPPEITERLKKAKEAARRTHALQQIEFIFPGPEGERWYEVRILSDDGREVVVVVRDITDRAVADRAQREAKQAAESANRSKSEFLASMSHELRTPLNAILNISESLGEGVYGAVNDKQQRSLQTVSESGRHLLGLINDILDLSKIEAGKLELNVSEIAVRPLCEASLRLVREQALNKTLELSFQIDPKLTVLQGDERKLKQILVNLLSNAIKFTPDDGRVGLEVRLENDTVAFTVWDTGIGISPEDLKKLFQPFVQLDSKLSRQYAGTGLGLSLAQRLAALHQGRVEVESKPGMGSRFTVYLPAGARKEAMGTPAKQKTSRVAGGAVAPTAKGPLVLLVEDTEANRECIGDYLVSKGFRLELATNGLDAIRQAAALRPDVVLMDIQMPGMDGFEAIRQLRKNPALAETPVVALTALAMDGDSERCLAAGATHYLSKPVALKELVTLLQTISAPPESTA